MLIKSMKMFWESFLWRLFQNIDEKPGFEKTVAVGEHLNEGRDHCHGSDTDILCYNQSVK